MKKYMKLGTTIILRVLAFSNTDTTNSKEMELDLVTSANLY